LDLSIWGQCLGVRVLNVVFNNAWWIILRMECCKHRWSSLIILSTYGPNHRPFLLFLLTINKALDVVVPSLEDKEMKESLPHLQDDDKYMTYIVDGVIDATLHYFKLYTIFNCFDDNLGFWIKPRSIISFSRFLLKYYDNDCKIQLFCMMKHVL